MPTGRSGIAAAVMDGNAFVFGGETFGSERRTFDEAEAYDPRTDSWTTLPPMPTARHGLGAATVGGRIHVLSGGPEAGLSYSSANEYLERRAP
jgi:N-acetylneuraminic acid mutarotase